MNPIQDFHNALKEFRQIAREVIPDRKMNGPRSFGHVKNFSNLEEFRQYHLTHYTYKGGSHKRKTPVTYKKRGITSKISVDWKENPKEWKKQYQWFINNPEAEVYAAKPRWGYKKRGITSKISVDRKENPKEWRKQYQWFINNPEAEVYAPREYGQRKK